MPNEKLEITQKEFDSFYTITTDDTKDEPTQSTEEPTSELEFLTQEQQEYENNTVKEWNIPKEIEE